MWKPRQRQRPQVHYQSRSGHEYLCTLLTPLLPGQILLYNRKNIYKWFGMNMWTCVYISRWGRTTSQIKIPVPADSEFETTEFLASKSCYTKFIIMTSSCLYLPYLGGQAFTKVNDPIVGQPKKPIQPTHESPLNHLWDPKLSELRPRTCVFFLQGRGLANGFYFCVFQLTTVVVIPATLKRQPGSVTSVTNPTTPWKPEAWIHQKNHGLIAIQVRV